MNTPVPVGTVTDSGGSLPAVTVPSAETVTFLSSTTHSPLASTLYTSYFCPAPSAPFHTYILSPSLSAAAWTTSRAAICASEVPNAPNGTATNAVAAALPVIATAPKQFAETIVFVTLGRSAASAPDVSAGVAVNVLKCVVVTVTTIAPFAPAFALQRLVSSG